MCLHTSLPINLMKDTAELEQLAVQVLAQAGAGEHVRQTPGPLPCRGDRQGLFVAFAQALQAGDEFGA